MNKKNKILFVTPSLCQGGLEHSLITMLKQLNHDKHEVTLYVHREDMTLLPLIPNYVHVVTDNVKEHYYRNPKIILLLIIKKVMFMLRQKDKYMKLSEIINKHLHTCKVTKPARMIFNKESYDVVISNAIGMSTEIAINIPAQKHYVFFRSSIDLHHDSNVKLFEKYDGIIGVSSGVVDSLVEWYPHCKDKIILLENYVEMENIIKKSEEDQEINEKRKNSQKITLCSCGRFTSEKGFDLAVRAADLLVKENYDFVWYFVGDGQGRENLDQLITEYSLEKYIVITGFVDNPFPYMKYSDIYIQPSYEESYGRTIKEALILGTPVISTSTVGGKVVLEDGNKGMLVDINESALAEGIKTLIDNQNLREKFVDVYSYDLNQKEQEMFTTKLEKILCTSES